MTPEGLAALAAAAVLLFRELERQVERRARRRGARRTRRTDR